LFSASDAPSLKLSEPANRLKPGDALTGVSRTINCVPLPLISNFFVKLASRLSFAMVKPLMVSLQSVVAVFLKITMSSRTPPAPGY
jgi:hypothetical protein